MLAADLAGVDFLRHGLSGDHGCFGCHGLLHLHDSVDDHRVGFFGNHGLSDGQGLLLHLNNVVSVGRVVDDTREFRVCTWVLDNHELALS